MDGVDKDKATSCACCVCDKVGVLDEDIHYCLESDHLVCNDCCGECDFCENDEYFCSDCAQWHSCYYERTCYRCPDIDDKVTEMCVVCHHRVCENCSDDCLVCGKRYCIVLSEVDW